MNNFGVGVFVGLLIGLLLAGAVSLIQIPASNRLSSAQSCVRTATTEKELNENCLRYFRPYARWED